MCLCRAVSMKAACTFDNAHCFLMSGVNGLVFVCIIEVFGYVQSTVHGCIACGIWTCEDDV